MTVPGNLSSPLLASAAEAAAAVEGPIKSLRFNSEDSARLSKTFGSAGNRKTWTWSGWFKRHKSESMTNMLFACYVNSSNRFYIGIQGGSDKLLMFGRVGGSDSLEILSDQVFRDFGAWYHMVVAIDSTQSSSSNRVKVYVNGSQISLATTTVLAQNGEPYLNAAVEHHLGFLNGSSKLNAYMADVYFIDGSQLDATSFGAFDDNGVWQAATYSGTYGTNGFHMLDFANESTVGHDSSGNENDFTAHNIGTESGNGNYISELNSVNDFYGNSKFVWGPTLFNGATGDKGPIPAAGTPMTYTPSSSITLTGTGLRIWVARNKGGLYINGNSVSSTEQQWNSFGTTYSPLSSIEWRTTDGSNFSQLSAIEINGTQLIDSSAVGKDLDILFDVPTNNTQSDTGAGGEVSGNYPTLNPLDSGTSSTTFSNGNLEASTSTSGWHTTRHTIGVSSGKWYWEVLCTSNTTGNGLMVGIIDPADSLASYVGSTSGGYSYNWDANKYNNGSSTSYGASFTDGDVISVAFDADAGTLIFYKNGASQGTAFSSIPAGTYLPATSLGNTMSATINHGARAFAYTAPSGYKALNTASMSAATIADGSDYFQTVLWDGTGSARSITTTGMSPDWVWIKPRNAAYNNALFDTVRGSGKRIKSNDSVAEDTDNNTLSGFNSDGFSLGTNNGVNQSSKTYVAWCWDAGSSTASNTDGSVTTSVRANASAGFSIVTFNSQSSDGNYTCGHGLNAAPELIFMKSRSRSGGPWWTFHASVCSTVAKTFFLNTNGPLSDNVAAGGGNVWGASLPTSSVFGFTTGSGSAHTQNETVVAYCFAPVSGFSAMGVYESNNSTDGPFIYTGFRPAFILFKADLNLQPWIIHDSARNGYNKTDPYLMPSNTSAELSDNGIDILSNGWKIRNNNAAWNGTAGTDVVWYAAAENPFQANGGLAR